VGTDGKAEVVAVMIDRINLHSLIASNWLASNWLASNWLASNWLASNWLASTCQCFCYSALRTGKSGGLWAALCRAQWKTGTQPSRWCMRPKSKREPPHHRPGGAEIEETQKDEETPNCRKALALGLADILV
jgi:hypothetical protein